MLANKEFVHLLRNSLPLFFVQPTVRISFLCLWSTFFLSLCHSLFLIYFFLNYILHNDLKLSKGFTVLCQEKSMSKAIISMKCLSHLKSSSCWNQVGSNTVAHWKCVFFANGLWLEASKYLLKCSIRMEYGEGKKNKGKFLRLSIPCCSSVAASFV